MKYPTLLVVAIAVLLCGSVSAQTPPPAPGLKMNLTGTESMAQVLQMIPAGTTVELHLRSGEKMAGVFAWAGGGKTTAGGTLVRLTKLTGAEFYDGLINIADISAVVIRGLPPVK